MKKNLTKKNRGSALMMVLIIMTISSMLGTAIISLAVINFKMKIVDKKVKTSQYIAEAGLEEAYALIAKVVEEGVKDGNTEVTNINQKLDKYFYTDIYWWKGNEYIGYIEAKKAIFEYYSTHATLVDKTIKDSSNTTIQESDGTIASIPDKDIYECVEDIKDLNGNIIEINVNEDKIKNLFDSHFKGKYKDYINNNLLAIIKPTTDSTSNSVKYTNRYSILNGTINNSKPSIIINSYKEFDDNPSPDTFQVEIKSTFDSEHPKQNIVANISIKIPDRYNAAYSVQNQIFELYENPLWKKAIAVDNSLLLKEGYIEIDGDVYSYGTSPLSDSGILVGNNNNNIDITFKGNIACGAYFKIKDSNNPKITQEDGNMFVNSFVVANHTGCANINIEGDLNTEDDLEINSNNTNVTIRGNYYGFNDGAYQRGGNQTLQSGEDKRKTPHDRSSSVIINCSDIGTNSSLNIIGDAMIAGVTHVNAVNSNDNTITDYLTGESVTIKGNYRAYAVELEDPSKTTDTNYWKDNINFIPYGPMTFADEFKSYNGKLNEPLDVIQRSKYIKYANDEKGGLNLGNGISIGNVIHSIGAYFKNNTLGESKVNLSDDALKISKFNEFNYYINAMHEFDPLYIGGQSIDSGLLSKKYIESFMNYSKNIDTTSTLNTDYEIVFINNNEAKKLAIVKQGESKPSGYLDDECIFYNGTREIRGIIVSKGELYIKGDFKFAGMIVSQKSLTLEGSNSSLMPLRIRNDVNYIKNKICENEDIRNNFKQDPLGSKILYKYKTNANVTQNTTLKLVDYITIDSWKKTN